MVNASLKKSEISQYDDYSNLSPEQFKGELSFFKQQLDEILYKQKFNLRDDGIAYAQSQSFFTVQIPMNDLDDETYQRNILPRIKENGWVFKKNIKNADIYCHGNNKQLEIIQPIYHTNQSVLESDKLAFSALEKEWNIGMLYQEQGTFYCGQSLPIIFIEE